MFSNIWGNPGKSKQSHTKKILKLQKRAARIILAKPTRTPSKEMLKTLNWLTFDSRCNYHTAIIVYKALNDLTPAYIKDIIHVSTNEKYNLRSATRQDIMHVRYNTHYKKQSFTFHGMYVWNILPAHLRKALSITSFKRNCKKFLFDHQMKSYQ